MRLDVGCEITFKIDEPTPSILMLRPRSGLGQQILEDQYRFSQTVSMAEYIDRYGNLCQRLTAPPGEFTVMATATADTTDEIDVSPGAPFTPVQDMPNDVLPFLLPSRYCQCDQLGEWALELVASAAPGYDQAAAICGWIHHNVTYRYGSSDASTSALDTAQQRVGVCRDFVHLGVALCRSLTIPARMVVGYLYQLDPMDMHAWFEAFVDGRWYTFDATQAEPRGGRVAIAYGRDAADVALATQYGPSTLTQMQVWARLASSSPGTG